MTNKEQLIEEFREKCKTSFASGGFLTTDLGDDFRLDTELIEAFLLSTFDAGRASGIEEVKEKVIEFIREPEKLPEENSPEIYGDKRQVAWHIGKRIGLNKVADFLSSLTPSSSKDN